MRRLHSLSEIELLAGQVAIRAALEDGPGSAQDGQEAILTMAEPVEAAVPQAAEAEEARKLKRKNFMVVGW